MSNKNSVLKEQTVKSIVLKWEGNAVKGVLNVAYGKIADHTVANGESSLKDGELSFSMKGSCRLNLEVAEATLTATEDTRSYAAIEKDIRSKGLLTELQQTNLDPEESFERAAAATTELHCETFLGLSRDMRIFSLDFLMRF